MIAFEALIFCILLILLSLCMGYTTRILLNNCISIPQRITFSLASGFVLLIALWILIGAVAGFVGLGAGLTALLMVVIPCVLCIVLFLIKREKILLPRIKDLYSKRTLIYHLVFAALFVVQVFAVINYSYNQIEAGRSIGLATKVYDEGVCQGINGIMNLWGVIAYVLKTHPLAIIYSVIPLGMLAFYYICYFEILMALSNDDFADSMAGLIIIELLNIWGFQSELLIPVTLLFSWFSLGCFMVHGLVPFVGMIILYYIKAHPIEDRVIYDEATDQDEDYQEEWDMKKHKIINARNLAIALGILAIMLVGFVFVLNNKINSLHASTVNLQEDLNSRCAVYEFSGEAEKNEGYLIKGSDGSITVIGGGDSANGQELYDFIKKYGDSVSNWYLYGTDAEEAGAYAYCVMEAGMSVDNVYVLSRTDLAQLLQ